MVECLAVSLAGPLREAVDITSKGIRSRASAGHHNLIAFDFPHHIIIRHESKRDPNRVRNCGLGLGVNPTDNHVVMFSDLLTSCNRI
jgi:hypothetical protein